MKIASINIRGFAQKAIRMTFFHWAEQNSIDILCIQETFCTTQNHKQVDIDWNGNIYHGLFDSPHSRGLAILFRERILNMNF